MNYDAIVIGSGIGGLTAGALLARYGKRVLICESHSVPGGAAHEFSRNGFTFDSGPSFYCGLGKARPSLNPLRQVLDAIEESIDAVAYDPLGRYHFPEGSFPVWSSLERYRQEVARITPNGARQLAAFEAELLGVYGALREIPTLALRADFQALPILFGRYGGALLKGIPHLGTVRGSVGDVVDRHIRDRWVRRLIDLECFLLSGLKASGTIAPEVAFMLGERTRAGVEYPLGGSGAIVRALVRGLERWGGTLRLGTRVEQILVEAGRATGVRLRGGETLQAPLVISNATVWDTYNTLLAPEALPPRYRQRQLATPAISSFMHLHLGIRADGLEGITGHHVVLHNADRDLAEPGNTCMISIPSVWDPGLAPAGHHVVHAYTLEPHAGWQRDADYGQRKRDRAQPLYRALEKIIPDVRSRIALELIGTPLTHARFLYRHQGTYGPAIDARTGLFPSGNTPIAGLYRVGDSTLPGIGVPAVAASGILCANTLATPEQVTQLCDRLGL